MRRRPLLNSACVQSACIDEMPTGSDQSASVPRGHTVACRSRIVAAALIAGALAAFSQDATANEATDQRGRTVKFDKPPQRVVFLPIPAPATYITIDGTESHIVGMNPYSASAMREGIFGKLFPGFSKIRTDVVATMGDPSNFAPNVEAILALRPDVVFQWATSSKDYISVLDRTGVPVLGMRINSQDAQETLSAYFAMMGQVAGKNARAEALIARQNDARSQLESRMDGLSPAQRPRVISLNRAAQLLRVSGKGSYGDFYIRLAGGQNVAHDSPPLSTVTIEQILAWNPQVVLLGNFDAAEPSDIYNDPRWQTVDAVRAHRVYKMPLGGYRWDPPSQESALTWIWLAGLLQPARAQQDIRAVMRDWYTFLYGHDLTDAEIDKILFVSKNGGSAGYERYMAHRAAAQ